MTIEKQIIDNALFYEKNGKAQVSAASDNECASWYKKIHQHFQQDVIPHMKQYQEHFVEYHPVWFSFGESSSYRQGIASDRMYRHTYGTYGTGSICFTDKNIYITALDSLTQEFPLYPTGSKGFFVSVLEGMLGERNDRKAYSGNKTWTVDYPSVTGIQITQVEGSSTEILYIKTTSVDWQIHQHFRDTLPEMLATIKMGTAGRLASIWNKSESKNSDIAELLKKLNELKEAGIITEAEFQQKKQQLLKQM